MQISEYTENHYLTKITKKCLRKKNKNKKEQKLDKHFSITKGK